MRDRRFSQLAGLLVAASVVIPASSAARQSSERPRSVTCSFSHPSYSGLCKQNAPMPKDGSAEEVCRDILKCLNDVRCIQTYCSATTIRGGWKLEGVAVEGEKK